MESAVDRVRGLLEEMGRVTRTGAPEEREGGVDLVITDPELGILQLRVMTGSGESCPVDPLSFDGIPIGRVAVTRGLNNEELKRALVKELAWLRMLIADSRGAH